MLAKSTISTLNSNNSSLEKYEIYDFPIKRQQQLITSLPINKNFLTKYKQTWSALQPICWQWRQPQWTSKKNSNHSTSSMKWYLLGRFCFLYSWQHPTFDSSCCTAHRYWRKNCYNNLPFPFRTFAIAHRVSFSSFEHEKENNSKTTMLLRNQ